MLNRIIYFLLLQILFLSAFAQKGVEAKVSDNHKRKLTKTEIKFMASKFDSVKFNINRMVMFEKELRQRNYYLNEKTALLDELIAMLKSLQESIEVINLETKDVKKIFGKPNIHSVSHYIYQLETFKSNCPFIEIDFEIRELFVTKIQYKIIDCERMK